MRMNLLFAIAVVILMVSPASAQQFGLVSGSAQIGHTPGRIDMLRPELKNLSLSEHVSFKFTVRWPHKDYNPCGEAEGCVTTVGIRYRPDGFTDTWSSFTLRTDTQTMSLDLPSKSDDMILPRGYHDVFVRITGRGHTLGIWFFPVAIHAQGSHDPSMNPSVGP